MFSEDFQIEIWATSASNFRDFFFTDYSQSMKKSENLKKSPKKLSLAN